MDYKAGQVVKVTITKGIRRDAARKTLERLFMKDHAISGPIDKRKANFAPKPKRRGGRIWTKYPNKLHPVLGKGVGATLKLTEQVAKDLDSVADLIEIVAA